MADVAGEVMEQLRDLPDDLKRKVLEFVRALRTPQQHGVPGRDLMAFSGVIPAEDLEAIRRAIEDGCERVDDEW